MRQPLIRGVGRGEHSGVEFEENTMRTSTGHRMNMRQPDRGRNLMGRPLLWCASVMAIALLSAYVHVLNEQVERGELRRQAQTVAPAPHGIAGPGYAPQREPGQGIARAPVAR
jgi:hypothetical protein